MSAFCAAAGCGVGADYWKLREIITVFKIIRIVMGRVVYI